MPEILQLRMVLALLRAQVADLRRQGAEDGYTTETLIITALLVAAAVVAGGIIVALIMRKANELSGA
ncbi:MAG TPA: hypothetical protein VGR74_01675 [Actinomycetota bacterium]|jgi:hypothetical protein|nr:hypothetical protein [Actinomycetota bacterium]